MALDGTQDTVLQIHRLAHAHTGHGQHAYRQGLVMAQGQRAHIAHGGGQGLSRYLPGERHYIEARAEYNGIKQQ